MTTTKNTLFPDIDQTVYQNKHKIINNFLKSKKNTGTRGNTLRQYSRVLHVFFHNYFPDTQPNQVEIHHIEQYLQLVEQNYDTKSGCYKTVTDKTKKAYLTSLSSFYKWASRRPKYPEITANPAAVILEEIKVRGKNRPDPATWENACKIVNAIPDPRDKTAVTILAKTGCRISEAVNIDTEDLMLQDNFIRLTERKGGAETVVPIDQETKHQIKTYKAMRKHRGHPALFTSNEGNRLNTTRIRRSIRKAATQEEIMNEDSKAFHEKFTPHTFRTVFTTLMRKQGMPDYILAYIRGDADSDMRDVYTKVDREEAKTSYLKHMKNIGLN